MSIRKAPTTNLLIDAYKHKSYSVNFDYRSIKSSIVQPKAFANRYIVSALALLMFLFRIRTAYGFTQAELAERSGVSLRSIQMYECALN